jgi:hypothetical protein
LGYVCARLKRAHELKQRRAEYVDQFIDQMLLNKTPKEICEQVARLSGTSALAADLYSHATFKWFQFVLLTRISAPNFTIHASIARNLF